jgi:hypothetical protein
MKSAKRLLMVAGAVAIAGILSVALAPRAVHAVVSTLVTVVNNVPVVNPTSSSGAQGVITEETDGAARQPVQAVCNVQNTSGPGIFGCSDIYTVPIDKRLVIEYASAQCITNANVYSAFLATAESGSSGPLQFLPVVNEGPAGGPGIAFAVGQSLRIYADPGSQVQLQFETTATASNASCGGSINGYLEPANIQ